MYEFSGLGHTIESRLTGTVFKILDTRQSEILIEFSRNIPFNSPKNSSKKLSRGFSDNFCGDIPVRVDSASQHEFFLSVTTIEIL